MRGEEFTWSTGLITCYLLDVTEASKSFFSRKSIIKYQHQIILNTGLWFDVSWSSFTIKYLYHHWSDWSILKYREKTFAAGYCGSSFKIWKHFPCSQNLESIFVTEKEIWDLLNLIILERRKCYYILKLQKKFSLTLILTMDCLSRNIKIAGKN